MRRERVTAVAVTVALGVALALSTRVVAADQEGGTDQGRVPPTVAATAAVSPTPVDPVAARGAADARARVGWDVLETGSPAARYWAQHGAGETGRAACEAALRVQFVRGYRDPTAPRDGSGAAAEWAPLWQAACVGVSRQEHDDMLLAAVEWSSSHYNGDEGDG